MSEFDKIEFPEDRNQVIVIILYFLTAYSILPFMQGHSVNLTELKTTRKKMRLTAAP